MRLIDVHVRHYRVHEDVKVRFHASTSLLGGMNEAGKSTLVEAVHRALFLPAKGDTQVHKDMRREGSAERPDVRLRFEHGGEEWELHKHFGGTRTYAVTLKRLGHPALEEEAAEQKLAELTGAAMPAGKRASDETVRRPWSHLWVWQGAGGDSPEGFIKSTTDDLVRITSEGAGAVLMSERDGQVAARFRREKEEIYGAEGIARVRKGCALGRANADREALEAEVAELEARVTALGRDADRHAEAKRCLEANEPEATQVDADLEALEATITAGRAVEARRDGAKQEHRRLQERAEGMREHARQLKEWREEVAFIAEHLEKDAEAQRLDGARETALKERDGVRRTLSAARDELVPLAARHERASARVRLLLSRRDFAAAEVHAARVEKVETELLETREDLERLPKLSADDLAELRERADDVRGDRARLKALSSTLEVLSSRQVPNVNGCPLETGKRVELGAESILSYGDELSVRLVVPDAAGVDELRSRLAEKEAAIEKSLSGYVIDGAVPDSIERLAEVVLRRQILESKHADLGARVKAENPERARAELSQARRDVQAAEAIDRDLPDPENWPDPDELLVAREIEESYAREHDEQKRQVARLETRLEEAHEALSRATTLGEEHARTRRNDEDRLKKYQALIEEYLRAHGGEHDAFVRALATLEQEEDRAKRALDVVQREYDELELDVLATRRARLIGRRDTLRDTLERARAELNESLGRLHQDDGSDPDTELREARERLERAATTCERERRDAEATALLHELFQEEIDAANETVTRPLAEKVSHYLRHLFGSKAQVNLRYEDGRFGEFYLVRPGFAEHEEAFSTLSGGAREQVAAAVRLATAEILAGQHGGTLPVVFDDAFVNTDPGRIEKVINMLYQAGTRGLQVIVSTCDPERYEDMGQVRWTVCRGEGAREA